VIDSTAAANLREFKLDPKTKQNKTKLVKNFLSLDTKISTRKTRKHTDMKMVNRQNDIVLFTRIKSFGKCDDNKIIREVGQTNTAPKAEYGKVGQTQRQKRQQK
jgi:hypothetical protein